MEDFDAARGDCAEFGGQPARDVKNVTAPLVFRALVEG